MTGLTGRFRVVSLRARILTATAVAVAIALLVALTVYAFTLDRILLDTSTASAQEQARQVARLILDQDSSPEHALGTVPAQGTVMQLIDANGRVIADNDPSAADVPLAGLRPAPGETQSEQVLGVPLDESDPYAVVAVGLEPVDGQTGRILLVASPLRTETDLVRFATLALGVLALICGGGLMLLIDRVLARALGDVERIRASVADIQAGDRAARVPVPPGDDEISRLAVTMNGMLDRLERADVSQRTFVSNASHELRSPLTTVRAVAETSPGGIDAAGTKVVAGEALRMQRLVDDLLTLAKADDRGLSVNPEDVDLDDVAVTELHRIRAATNLTAVGEISAGRVTGDPMRLSQVVHNLVDNAVRHARSAVRVGVATTAATVQVWVDNDGAVVPVADREAVFERFTRLQEARDRDSGGSGLGLAIVKAIVQAHGGTVTAGEAPDGWCRFLVELPAQVDASDPPA